MVEILVEVVAMQVVYPNVTQDKFFEFYTHVILEHGSNFKLLQ
jgi:hypothetical protein